MTNASFTTKRGAGVLRGELSVCVHDAASEYWWTRLYPEQSFSLFRTDPKSEFADDALRLARQAGAARSRLRAM